MVPWTLSPLLHPRRPSLVAVQNLCPAKNIKPEKIWITRDQWPNKGGRIFSFQKTQRDLRDAIGWMAHHFKESKQQIHIMKIKYFLNHCYLLKFHSSFFKRMHQSKVPGWIKSRNCFFPPSWQLPPRKKNVAPQVDVQHVYLHHHLHSFAVDTFSQLYKCSLLYGVEGRRLLQQAMPMTMPSRPRNSHVCWWFPCGRELLGHIQWHEAYGQSLRTPTEWHSNINLYILIYCLNILCIVIHSVLHISMYCPTFSLSLLFRGGCLISMLLLNICITSSPGVNSNCPYSFPA